MYPNPPPPLFSLYKIISMKHDSNIINMFILTYKLDMWYTCYRKGDALMQCSDYHSWLFDVAKIYLVYHIRT